MRDAVVLADKVAIGGLCGGLLLAAHRRCSLRAGRAVGALAAVVAVAASLYGDVARGEISVGYVTLLYMLAVGAIPFEPWHAFGLGGVLTGLLHVMGTYLPPVLTGSPGLVRSGQLMQLGVATALLTGISALLHVSRYRQHKARQEAEAMRDEAEAMREEVAELEAAKSRFFANLSHDLRTPLTLMIGPLEDALGGRYGTIPEVLRRRLRVMEGQAKRLRMLVSQLLWLSELDEGKQALEARPIELQPFLERMTSLFRSMAERKAIEVRLEVAEDLHACADPEALRRIVSNLLSNALEHTPEEGTVRVRARPINGHGEKAALSVRDSGPGLPEDLQGRLFDRYVGAESAGDSSPIDMSTGIGLSLVKELAERHGGTVEAESEQDFGTEITVTLPRGREALPEEDLASKSERDAEEEDAASGPEGLPEGEVEPEVRYALAETASSGYADPGGQNGIPSGETPPGEAPSEEVPEEDRPVVLVADDEAEVREYLAEVLAPRYRVQAAEDGEEALTAAREAPPDLIISDVSMPRRDGFELCRAIRNDETLRAVPIVLLTVQKGEDSRLEGLRQGADAYVEKPFRPEELRQRAENLIDIRQYIRSGAETGENENRQNGQARPAPSAEEENFAGQARALVEEHAENSNFGVEWLADEMDLSARQLQRRLKAETGLSAGAFIRAVRLRRAAALLEDGTAETVKAAAQAVGYRDPSHFSRLFKEAHGHPPSDLKS